MSERDCTHFTYRTPHGRITLAANGEAITSLAFGNAPLEGTPRPSELTTRASTEVLEYFAGKRTAFDVPLAPAGSPFQHAVWKAACAIPYGQTRTFSEIACLIGEPDAYRSVGAACRRNPALPARTRATAPRMRASRRCGMGYTAVSIEGETRQSV